MSYSEGRSHHAKNVYLHVYDVHWSTILTRFVGLGAYHCGIEVFDYEFSFGGHPHDFTGISYKEPALVDDQRLTYRERITLGTTNYSRGEVEKTLESWGDKDWRGMDYHLLIRNCNHFCNALSKELLCGKEIPSWINRLATAIDLFIPFAEELIPNQWLRPSPADYGACDCLDCRVDEISREDDTKDEKETAGNNNGTRPNNSKLKLYVPKPEDDDSDDDTRNKCMETTFDSRSRSRIDVQNHSSAPSLAAIAKDSKCTKKKSRSTKSKSRKVRSSSRGRRSQSQKRRSSTRSRRSQSRKCRSSSRRTRSQSRKRWSSTRSRRSQGQKRRSSTRSRRSQGRKRRSSTRSRRSRSQGRKRRSSTRGRRCQSRKGRSSTRGSRTQSRNKSRR